MRHVRDQHESGAQVVLICRVASPVRRPVRAAFSLRDYCCFSRHLSLWDELRHLVLPLLQCLRLLFEAFAIIVELHDAIDVALTLRLTQLALTASRCSRMYAASSIVCGV